MFSGQTFGGAHKSISMFLYSKILVLSVAPFSLYNLVQFNKLAASCLNVVHRHVLFSLLIIKKKKKVDSTRKPGFTKKFNFWLFLKN